MSWNHRRRAYGRIVGVAGNMGGGKTGLLIGWANEPRWQRDGVMFLQPIMGSRSAPEQVRSRTQAVYEKAVPIEHPTQILELVRRHGCRNNFVEEFQFLGRTPNDEEECKKAALTMREEGLNLFWSGLPLNFRAEPFPLIGWMMAMSDQLTPLHPACAACGTSPAPFPQRLYFGQPAHRGDELYVADTPEFWEARGLSYEARCADCYQLPDEPTPVLQAILASQQAAFKRGQREPRNRPPRRR